MYKLSFYVPASHLEQVKKALFASGAGKYQCYDQCCWQTVGQGQFRPLAGSSPHLGQTGQLETIEEYKVEMVCIETAIKAAVQALRSSHPYEQPAYEIYRMLTPADL
jgi:hypothetical protein